MENPPSVADPNGSTNGVATTEATNSAPIPENPDAECEKITSSSSSDALSKALSTILSNVIRDFDSEAQNTLKSQDQLNSSLDRLTGELDGLLADAPLPFIMQHAAKITAVRKRVSSLNSVLKSIQRRIDNMDRAISLGTAQLEKTNSATP
ncbi:hypothetical protein LINGRAHAP2_LOCUS21740 [Linum grandiflorum]